MQDFSVNAAAWITPDFAQSDRRAADEVVPYEVDEALLAQFEAFLPVQQGECADASNADEGTSSVDGVGGAGAVGSPAAAAFAAATSPSEASLRSRDVRAPDADTVVSSYTIHHARVGVVHVQQSTAVNGGVGAIALSTDDDSLRARLREAMPALRGAMTDGDGRGPDLSVDA